MSSTRSLLVSMATLVMAAPAFAADSAPADKLPPCTIVLGGGGTSVGDAKFDGMWHQINRVVTDAVIEELRRQNYKAELVFTMKLHDCAKVLQVTHLLTRGAQPSVDFEIAVVHLDEGKKPKKGKPQTGKMVSEYSKKYHYAFDEKFMQGSLSELGTGYARDVIASGVLSRSAD